MAPRVRPCRLLAAALLVAGSVFFLVASSLSFVAAPRGAEVTRVGQASAAAVQQWQAAAAAATLASMPAPAHAGGMFDFGITLPFVAITFLTMMATLNALWYAPVTAEVDDRNAKLLKTLSEATDMLSKADEIQVEYTEQIRAAREKAAAEVKAYREKTEKVIATQIASATAERDAKAAEVRKKLEQDIEAKKNAAEAEIERRKAAFVKDTLAGVAL
mmetsp:Transcript_90589/g.228323  ORF Transcript_90589/g.228323 Transcript_90589/m.228323 type:complete len:217 (+) Transcript_90589:86-736(+)